MAKPAKTKEPKIAPILPLPAPLLHHHGKTLFSCMEQWLKQNHAPPVLLVTGPEGIGKRAIIYWLSQWLLCSKTQLGKTAEDSSLSLFGDTGENAAPASEVDLFGGPVKTTETDSTASLQPCGECPNCQRALNNNWVDFNEISSDQNEDSSKNIKIEHFRKLKASLGFGAFDGAFKITLIRDADRMTVQAANSLLKILEEPPPGWIFFLTATDPSLLLPTLVSRCQTLRLKPFPTSDLQDLLALTDAPKERQVICAKLAEGSWSKALSLVDQVQWDKRASVFRFIERPHAELNNVMNWAGTEPQNLELLIDFLEQITGELLHWSLNPQDYPWKNSDCSKTLLSHANTVCKKYGSIEAARNFWLQIQDRIFYVRENALAPLNRKLLVQEVLMPWLEI